MLFSSMFSARGKTQENRQGRSGENPRVQVRDGGAAQQQSLAEGLSALGVGSSASNKFASQRDPRSLSLFGHLTSLPTEFARGLKDLGYVCVAVPKALHEANRLDFYVSSVANVLKGAQEFARTWAGSVFAGIIVSGGQAGGEYLWPCAVTLAAMQFAGRWLQSISMYQAVSETVGVRRSCTLRLIDGIIGQRLNKLSDENFAQAAAVARTNQWVPYNLGNFYYPILQQASSFLFVGSAVALQAPPAILLLAVGMTLPSIVSTLVSTRMATRDEAKMAKQVNKAARLSTYLTAVEYLRSIKIDGTASLLKQLREQSIGPSEAAEQRRGQVSFYLNSISAGIFSSCLVACLYQVGQAALSGTMEPTRALLISGAILQLSDSVSNLVNSSIRMLVTAPYLRALQDIERSIEIQSDGFKPLIPQGCVPGLHLKDASIYPPGGREPVLRNISLVIKPGSFTALYGKQGCGKTTLLDHMAGLRHLTEGGKISAIVKKDLVPISNIDSREWIRTIGFCSQRPLIYEAATLRDNITCEADHKGSIDHDFIVKLLEFVDQSDLLDQLDSLVGATCAGRDFSGGQTQLIALMRALYKRPKLLFLDEALANVQQQSAETILEKICNLSDLLGWQPTIVMVTHSPSHLRYADQIALLAGGCQGVIRCGSFDELRETGEI
jgi:ABC-type multidrug transport system fused ATPase/permease subunit